MINSTRLKNFKNFKNETVFNVSQLNLLTGINGPIDSSYKLYLKVRFYHHY